MTIEKLPSGSYRITQMYKGKRYRRTLPYKPTQKEAVMIMAELFDQVEEVLKDNYSVEAYLDSYLNECRRRQRPLSPSTVRNYASIVRNLSDGFKRLRFMDVTEDDIRKELDRYRAGHSSKSVYNMRGFLNLVFSKYRPGFVWSYNLSKDEKMAEYEPSTTDIQKIIDDVVGTRYEIPFRLAVLGLRRGEICALTSSDLSDMDVLTIDKAIVLNESNTYEIKAPKTQASNRRIKIPHDLAELIRQHGLIYEGSPHRLNKKLHQVQKKLNIPSFKFHMLRHFAVAYLHYEGFTSEQIMSFGGWSTDSIMKRAYRYNLNPEESQQAISDAFDKLNRRG